MKTVLKRKPKRRRLIEHQQCEESISIANQRKQIKWNIIRNVLKIEQPFPSYLIYKVIQLVLYFIWFLNSYSPQIHIKPLNCAENSNPNVL